MTRFPGFGHHFPVFLFFWEAYFVLGRDGTEEFVPGHLLLPLSRDKGTPGQDFFFVPGQRDNGTSRPGLSRDVPSRGNPSTEAALMLSVYKVAIGKAEVKAEANELIPPIKQT